MGIMGTDFLAGHVVTIDWPSRRVYLDRVAAQGSRAIQMELVGSPGSGAVRPPDTSIGRRR
jgi:hypothetical protein